MLLLCPMCTMCPMEEKLRKTTCETLRCSSAHTLRRSGSENFPPTRGTWGTGQPSWFRGGRNIATEGNRRNRTTGRCVTTFPPPLPVLFPEPALHDFRLETDQVAEFDRRHAGVAEVADLADAASDVSGNIIGGPEGVGRWLCGLVGLWCGG